MCSGAKILVAAVLFAATVSQAAVKRPAIEPRFSGAAVGEWTMDHAAALAQARAGTNHVVVLFNGAWWCPHCQALENVVLTNAAWQAYVETNRLYLVTMDFPGRADQYWCWLRETNYVEQVAGLTLEQGEAEITNRYALQTAYAVPGAATNTVNGVSYQRVGYPTLIVLRPDGTRLGRFSPLATTVSLEMVMRNMNQILAADAWDETDDYYPGATPLAAPPCEDEEVAAGAHTLSEADAADWFSFDAEAGMQWAFALRTAAAGATNTVTAQIFDNPTNKVAVAERDMIPSDIAVLSYVVPQSGRYWLKLSRAAGVKQLQGYELVYWCGDAPATVLFASPRVEVSESGPVVTLSVTITGASEDAEVRVGYETIAGSALPGLDYTGTAGELVWGVGVKRPKTITVALLPDAVWEPDEFFDVALYAVKNCSVGEQLSTCRVVLHEQNQRRPGTLRFEGAASALLTEGSNTLFSVTRTAGADGAVTALVDHVEGLVRTPVARLAWTNGEAGAKTFAFAFAAEPGWQPDRTSSLRLTAVSGASAAASASAVALTRRDDWVVETLAEYLQDPAHRFYALRASRGVWFNGFCSDAERGDAWLRSGVVAPGASATLTGTLNGPGVLSFDWRLDGADASVQCLLGSLLTDLLPAAGLRTGATLAIPGGANAVSWTVRGGAAASEAAGAVRALQWYPLPVCAAPQPAQASAVINRAQVFTWQDVLAGAPFPAGATARYEFCAGVRGGALAKWSEQSEARFPRAGVPEDRAALEELIARAGTAPLYWRVDTVVTDAQGRRAVNTGPVWQVTVLPEGSPEFVVSDGGFDPAAPGGVALPDLTVGVRCDAGPFACAVAPGDVVRVAVRNGRLPAGVRAEVRGEAVWLTGVPLRPGQGAADLHVSVRRDVGGRRVTQPGTSLTVRWNVLGLGRAAGQYNGYLVVGDEAGHGSASVAVSATGRVSGRVMRNGLTYTFSAACFDGLSDALVVTQALARAGTQTGSVGVTVAPDGSGVRVRFAGEEDRFYLLWRNNWADAGGAALLGSYAGYYTVALPVAAKSSDSAPGGTGYLTLTVRSNGRVSYAGRLADGKSVSGSSILLYGPDCCSALDRATLYVLGKPSGYRPGSGVYGVLYFEPGEGGGVRLTTVSPAEASGLRWINSEPQSVFGYDPVTGLSQEGVLGFTNSLDVTGGFYDKTISLQTYYGGMPLALQSVFHAPPDFDGQQGASGYGLHSLPEPLRLPAVVSGPSSLAFPATALVMNGSLVDYAASVNPWALGVRPNLRTGVFTGSFKACYQGVSDGQPKQKTRSFKATGVLLPVRAAYQTYPEWMGCYLIPDACHSLTGGGRPVSYRFNWSYDFLLSGSHEAPD